MARLVVDQADRRALERAGWRTLLEYRENLVRGRDGRLLGVEAHWIAEAERMSAPGVVAAGSGATPPDAWAALRRAADAMRVTRPRRHHRNG